MEALRDSARKGLELQGFTCGAGDGVASHQRWIRFTPAVSTLVLATATVERSPSLFWAFGAVAAVGAVSGVHAFDVVFNHVVRHVVHAERLPPNPLPRRFAMLVAGTGSVCVGALFSRHSVVAGTVLGGLLTTAGLLAATTHFCVGSWMYRRLGLAGATMARAQSLGGAAGAGKQRG